MMPFHQHHHHAYRYDKEANDRIRILGFGFLQECLFFGLRAKEILFLITQPLRQRTQKQFVPFGRPAFQLRILASRSSISS